MDACKYPGCPNEITVPVLADACDIHLCRSCQVRPVFNESIPLCLKCVNDICRGGVARRRFH